MADTESNEDEKLNAIDFLRGEDNSAISRFYYDQIYNRATLQPIIQQFVAEGSRVITDELAAYNGLVTLGYTHAVVAHGAEEYANGDVFTNSIEGFWSHFRRMIVGCYHDVSDEHLQSYIDEAVYRWNTRKMSESERFAHMFDKSIGLVRKWSEIRVGLVAA